MTKEEILKFADVPTFYGVRITFHSIDDILVGFFSNNTQNTEIFHANKWNFNITSTNEITLLDGNDIKHIHTIKISEI